MGIIREIQPGEEQLIARCRMGDNNALYAIYSKYAKMLLNSSYRIVQNLADAEDITQEAFVDAFRSLNKYSGTHSFEGWLRRIVINKSISFLRRKRPQWLEIEKVSVSEDSSAAINEEGFALDVQRVKEAIATLPQQLQLVFTLFAIDDLPQQEIAEMLGISHSNVRVIYYRAKNKILEQLKSQQLCKNN